LGVLGDTELLATSGIIFNFLKNFNFLGGSRI
jgi:hypothetical protein